MVAIAYDRAPELFLGMTQDEIARSIGVHPRAFKRFLVEVREQLGCRAAASRKPSTKVEL